MSPDPIPTYVYKIVPTAPPEPFPAENPLSELDQTDGFVHLSTAVQVCLSWRHRLTINAYAYD